jgi:hypothetical protein
MSQNSGCYKGSASSGWTHGSNENSFYDISEGLFFILVLIPSSLIEELSNKLNWWLCAVLLLRRHIEVIHKHNALACLGTVKAFSLSVHLAVDDVLCLDGGSLSGEAQLDRGVFC